MDGKLLGTNYSYDQFRQAGFSEDELQAHVEKYKPALIKAGFSDLDISSVFPETIARQDLSDMPIWDDRATFQNYLHKQPMESWEDMEDGFAESFSGLTNSFVAQGYTALEAWHKGWGQFIVSFEEGSRYVNNLHRRLRKAVGVELPWEEQLEQSENWLYSKLDTVAQQYMEYADYWKQRVDQVGANVIDEFFGEFFGGAVPGLTEWFLNVGWAGVQGAVEAEKKGENELVGFVLSAARRKVLGMVFHSMGSFRRYLQSPLMGTVMGIEAAASGGDIGKAAGTGFLLPWFAPGSPGERMGLNEYKKLLRSESKKLIEKKVREEHGNLLTTRDPLTSQELALFPAEYPEITKTAIMYEGKVLTSNLHDRAPHPIISAEYGLIDKTVITGFLDKNGQFVYQYPQEAAKILKQWEEKGIHLGDPAVHFRSTDRRVDKFLDPEQHMGLIHGSEKKLAKNYGLEGEGGLMIPRVYAYKSAYDREGVIPSGGFYIMRIDGPILRASSPEAQKIYEAAEKWIGGAPKEIPGLTLEVETKGVITFINAKIFGRDAGSIEIVPKEGGFFLRNINVLKLYRGQGVGENLVKKATDQFGKITGMTQKTPEGEGFFGRLEEKKKYAPGDYNAIQLVFERMVRDRGYGALDTETQQGYKIFKVQRVGNISRSLISELNNKLESEGGFTHDLMENADMVGQPLHSVSVYKERELRIPIKEFTQETIRKYIADNHDLLTLPNHALGGWESEGKYVLDVAKLEPSRLNAIRLMIEHNQEAIFDLKNKMEITRAQGERELAQAREAMMGGRVGLPGIPEGEEELAPRKYLGTVKESMSTEQMFREKIEEIKPQDREILHDKDMFAQAEFRISTPDGVTRAIEDLREGRIPLKEQGYVAVALMRKLQAEEDYTRAAQVLDDITYTATDIGRLMRSLSLWNDVTGKTFTIWAQKQLDKVNSNRTWLDMRLGSKKVILNKMDEVWLTREKRRIDQMPDGVEKMNDHLRLVDYVAKMVPPGVSELIDAYRYQNMLSGWPTQWRNIGTNTIQAFATRPWDIATRGMIDYLGAQIFGKDREYYMSNVKDYYKTSFNSLPNALEVFMQALRMKTEFEKPELGLEAKTLFEQARARQIPLPFTMIQRFMEGQDKFFSTLIAAGEEAANLKNGMPLEEARARGRDLAQRYLFREKLGLRLEEYSVFSNALEGIGLMMEGMRRMKVIGPVSKWVVPFLRTPLNVGIQMIEHSPLTAMRKLSSWDKEVAARFINGSIMTGVGAMFTIFGETTWLPPSGEEEKKWWYATGRKPFSVRIGHKWVPMWYLGPFALAFALPTMMKYYTSEEKAAMVNGWYEKMPRMLLGLTRFIASQTSTQSIGQLFDLLSGSSSIDPAGFINQTFGQMIPAQSFLRWMARIIDPVYRKPEGLYEKFLAVLPFVSEQVPPQTKPFGEESERIWWNALIPWDLGKEDLTYKDLWPIFEAENRADYLKRAGVKALQKAIERSDHPERMKAFLEEYERINEKFIEEQSEIGD